MVARKQSRANEPERVPPPASWSNRVAAALRARDIEVGCLVDGERALAAWFAADMEPESAAQLDAVDAAMAKWMATLTAITRTTYQQCLRTLAARLSFEGPRPVRQMLDDVISKPRELDKRLTRLHTTSGWKTGTLCSRLAALHRASIELLRAGLAKQYVALKRPKIRDVEVRATDAEAIARLDEALTKSATPIAARTRAILQVGYSAALRPKEIAALRFEHLNLQRSRIRVGPRWVRVDGKAIIALFEWLDHRGRTTGPLFVGYDGRTGRITNKGITSRQIQRELATAAEDAGVEITMGAIRGAALLRRADGGRAAAQRASRNASRDGVNRLLRAHGEHDHVA